MRRRPWGQQKPPLGYRLDKSSPLAQGLVGCWLFNEPAGTRYAELVNKNDGIASATAIVGDYVDINNINQSIVPINPSAFTIGGFSIVTNIRDNNTATNSATLWSWVGSRTTAFSTNWTSYTGKPILYLLSGDTCFAYYNQSNLKNGAFHHMVLTMPEWSRNGLLASKFYVDSISQGISSIVSSSEPAARTLGRIGDNTSIFALKAALKYFYYYNRALSPDEVAALYAEPFVMFEGWNYARFFSIPSGVMFNPVLLNTPLVNGSAFAGAIY